jgi:TM2 domain-containing membrane protein YozV
MQPGDPRLSQASSKKMAAGLCGIFLGWLGIHKFILGYTTSGVIMLVVSIVTCGSIMSIVGLIEGIIYLTKSDADFYQTYIANKKEWF